MEQLLNLINISFFKLFSSPDDTVTKVGWLFVSEKIKNASNKLKVLPLADSTAKLWCLVNFENWHLGHPQ